MQSRSRTAPARRSSVCSVSARSPSLDRALAAGQKARANAMGDGAEAQIEAGGLDLIVLDRLQGLDLAGALDRVAQQLRRQDPGGVLELSRFRRGKQFPSRPLALARGEQLDLARLAHPATILRLWWRLVLSHGARREKRAASAQLALPRRRPIVLRRQRQRELPFGGEAWISATALSARSATPP